MDNEDNLQDITKSKLKTIPFDADPIGTIYEVYDQIDGNQATIDRIGYQIEKKDNNIVEIFFNEFVSTKYYEGILNGHELMKLKHKIITNQSVLNPKLIVAELDEDIGHINLCFNLTVNVQTYQEAIDAAEKLLDEIDNILFPILDKFEQLLETEMSNL